MCLYCVDKGSCILDQTEPPASELPSRFDDLGSPLACILLGLCHALSGHLVGIVGGTHCDFVLDRPQRGQVGDPGAKSNRHELKTCSAHINGQEIFLGKGLLPGHMLLNAFKASLRIVLANIGQVEIEDVRSSRDVRLWNLDALRDCKKINKNVINRTDDAHKTI